MTTYYVATVARYVLVDAENEEHVRQFGRVALEESYEDLPEQLGRDVQVEIRIIRPATADEIEFNRWNQETLAREKEMGQTGKRPT